MASLFLPPCFAAGLAKTRPDRPFRCLLQRGDPRLSRGHAVLLTSAAAAMVVAGMTISAIGATVTFVPQDLRIMRTTPAALEALNPRLIPLIAHDRAGFGAGVTNVGFLVLAIIWCGRPSPSRWQAIAVAAAVGFEAAIGVHPAVGYNSPVHLAPAVAGAVAVAVGLWMTRPVGAMGVVAAVDAA